MCRGAGPRLLLNKPHLRQAYGGQTGNDGALTPALCALYYQRRRREDRSVNTAAPLCALAPLREVCLGSLPDHSRARFAQGAKGAEGQALEDGTCDRMDGVRPLDFNWLIGIYLPAA